MQAIRFVCFALCLFLSVGFVFAQTAEQKSLFSKEEQKLISELTELKLSIKDNVSHGHLDGDIPDFWGIRRIGADLLHLELKPEQFKKQQALIGIIDTGFDYEHPVIKPMVFDKNLSKYKQHDHGTHTGATITGVAPFCVSKGLPVRLLLRTFFNKNAKSKDDVYFQKNIIGHIKDLAAKKVSVVNASLVFGYNAGLAEAIGAILKPRGILYVNSAGNKSRDINKRNNYQYANADDSVVLFVASISPNGISSSFSNYGKPVFISAPGQSIYSLLAREIDKNKEKGFKFMTWTNASGKTFDLVAFKGTSMASPHVVGTIGMMKLVNPKLTYQQIKGILTAMAIDLGPKGRDDYYGHGLVNSYGCVHLAKACVTQDLLTAQAALKKQSKQLALEADMLLKALVKSKDKKQLALAFQKVRQAYFLDPNNLARKKQLFLLHTAFGFKGEANALAVELFSATGEQAYLALVPKLADKDWFRLMSQFSELTFEQKLDYMLAGMEGNIFALGDKSEEKFADEMNTIERFKLVLDRVQPNKPALYNHKLRFLIIRIMAVNEKKTWHLDTLKTYLIKYIEKLNQNLDELEKESAESEKAWQDGKPEPASQYRVYAEFIRTICEQLEQPMSIDAKLFESMLMHKSASVKRLGIELQKTFDADAFLARQVEAKKRKATLKALPQLPNDYNKAALVSAMKAIEHLNKSVKSKVLADYCIGVMRLMAQTPKADSKTIQEEAWAMFDHCFEYCKAGRLSEDDMIRLIVARINAVMLRAAFVKDWEENSSQQADSWFGYFIPNPSFNEYAPEDDMNDEPSELLQVSDDGIRQLVTAYESAIKNMQTQKAELLARAISNVLLSSIYFYDKQVKLVIELPDPVMVMVTESAKLRAKLLKASKADAKFKQAFLEKIKAIDKKILAESGLIYSAFALDIDWTLAIYKQQDFNSKLSLCLNSVSVLKGQPENRKTMVKETIALYADAKTLNYQQIILESVWRAGSIEDKRWVSDQWLRLYEKTTSADDIVRLYSQLLIYCLDEVSLTKLKAFKTETWTDNKKFQWQALVKEISSKQ